MNDTKTHSAGLAPWLCFVLTACVFVWRAAPGVSFEDSGELAAATVSLGVPHPPGYPLQMLAGYGWQSLVTPLVGDAGRALNLFSAICAAAAAGLLSWFARRSGAGFGAALASGLLLALAPTFAAQAVIVEVYALAALLQVALLVSSLSPGPARPARTLLLFGLALCAHPNTLVLAPLPLFTLWRAWRESESASVRMLATSAVSFIAGLSLYAYVPLRAASDPAVNWGEASGGARLANHLLRTQYRTGLDRAYENQFSLLAEQLAGQWPLLFGLLALSLFVCRARVPGRLVAQVLFCVAFASAALFYAINWPLEDELSRARVAGSYGPLVLAVSAVGSLALIGIERTLESKLTGNLLAVLLPVAVVLLAQPFGPVTFEGELDQRGRNWAQSYADEVLEACPANSVLVVSKLGYGDDLTFPLLYAQVANDVRPDVLVLSREFLVHGWFRDQLGRREPWLGEALGRLSQEFESETAQIFDPRSRRILTASCFPKLYDAAAREARPVVFVARPGERILAGRTIQAGPVLWHLSSLAAFDTTLRSAPSGYDWLPADQNDPILRMLIELAEQREHARL